MDTVWREGVRRGKRVAKETAERKEEREREGGRKRGCPPLLMLFGAIINKVHECNER